MSTPTLTAGVKATVLVDLLPKSSVRSRAITRDIVLVLGFALTGQTFAVLLSGAALGMRRGIASQAVYWGLGLTGLPFYAGGDGGWQNGTGSTLGYFVGFVVAAGVIGKLAERRHDREVMSSLAAMAFGTVIIYAFGALWLAHDLNIPVANGEANAIAYGVTPFLVGDLLKLALAGLLTPLAWATVSSKGK